MSTPKKSAAPSGPSAQMTYRDMAYTSRVHILADDRQLVVKGGRVTVSADDDEALAYLANHADLLPE